MMIRKLTFAFTSFLVLLGHSPAARAEHFIGNRSNGYGHSGHYGGHHGGYPSGHGGGNYSGHQHYSSSYRPGCSGGYDQYSGHGGYGYGGQGYGGQGYGGQGYGGQGYGGQGSNYGSSYGNSYHNGSYFNSPYRYRGTGFSVQSPNIGFSYWDR